MTYSPIPIFKNVNMEVESSNSSGTTSNLSADHKFEMPTFSLSGVSVSNDILTLPSGYSYYIIGGVLGGNTGDHSYDVRIDWYNEDTSSYVGSSSYYRNSSTSPTQGASHTNVNASRIAARFFIRDADISTNINLSLRLRTLTDGPFKSYNYIYCIIHRVPTPT